MTYFYKRKRTYYLCFIKLFLALFVTFTDHNQFY